MATPRYVVTPEGPKRADQRSYESPDAGDQPVEPDATVGGQLSYDVFSKTYGNPDGPPPGGHRKIAQASKPAMHHQAGTGARHSRRPA